MQIFYLGLFIGLLPSLIIALVTTRNSSSLIATMRERLAAEEASKRHFMQQASQLELTVERMHQEQKRLEVELARLEGAVESLAV
jgi:predicted nuclease with TOPRIM domain